MALVFFLLGLVLRAAVIHRSMAYDEAYSYLAFAKTGFFDSYTRLYNTNNHLLNTFFTDLSVRAFGPGPVSVRLSAFLFGMASIAAVYFFFTRLSGKRAGLLGAFLLAISAYHIRYSTESRGYTAFLFFTLLAVWNLLEAIETKRLLPWILFAASLILTVFSNSFGLMLLAPFGLFGVVILLASVLAGKSPGRDFWVGAGLAAVLAAAGIVLLYAPTLPIGEYFQSLWKTGKLPAGSFMGFAVEIYPYDGKFLENLFAQLGWGGGWRLWAAGVLAVLGVWRAYAGGKWKEATLFLFLTAVPLAIAKITGMITVYRLFFYCIPFYGYFVVQALLWLGRGRAWPGIVLCAVLFVPATAQYMAGDGRWGVDGDWRRAMEFIQKNQHDDDFVSGDPVGEPASHEGIAVQFYRYEYLDSGDLPGILDGEIGAWRLQFHHKPDPPGFAEAFRAKDLKLYSARKKITFAPRWPSASSKDKPSVFFIGPDGRAKPGTMEWDPSGGTAAFVIPRGMKKALFTGERFSVARERPFVLALRPEGDFRGFVRVDFISGDAMNFNFDVRRLIGTESGGKILLLKGFVWRSADEGMVRIEIMGSPFRDMPVRLSELKFYEGE